MQRVLATCRDSAAHSAGVEGRLHPPLPGLPAGTSLDSILKTAFDQCKALAPTQSCDSIAQNLAQASSAWQGSTRGDQEPAASDNSCCDSVMHARPCSRGF